MKGGEMHIVPLNPFMLGVLDKCARRSGCDLLFPGPGGFPISDTSLRDILREHQIKNDDATLHGFRSTFRDWAAESGIADDVAEACIAHRVTVADDGTSKTATAVERAYRRTTHVAARVDVMARWGKYIDLNRDAP
jgi:integrase